MCYFFWNSLGRRVQRPNCEMQKTGGVLWIAQSPLAREVCCRENNTHLPGPVWLRVCSERVWFEVRLISLFTWRWHREHPCIVMVVDSAHGCEPPSLHTRISIASRYNHGCRRDFRIPRNPVRVCLRGFWQRCQIVGNPFLRTNTADGVFFDMKGQKNQEGGNH